MSESRWFTELCESHGLVPVAPITAAQLTAGHVLFSTIGTPQPVARVRALRRAVSVRYVGGRSDLFAFDAPISLVARVNTDV